MLWESHVLKEIKEATAGFFFGALSDLYLTILAWFIFDDNESPTIFRNFEENNTYAVVDVIASAKRTSASINDLNQDA